MDITQLNEKNIVAYASSLADSEIKEQISSFALDHIQSRSSGPAYRMLRGLQEALKVSRLDASSQNFYNDVVLKLKFIAFHMLPPSEQSELLEESLLFALEQELDVQERINFVFFPYYLGKDDLPKLTGLIKAYEANEEQLGSTAIRLGSAEVEPTLKNWITDFRGHLQGKRGVGFNVATYLTASGNARTLSKPDLEILKNVLSTYFWLKFEAVPPELLTLDLQVLAEESSASKPPVRPETAKAPSVAAPIRPRPMSATIPMTLKAPVAPAAPKASFIPPRPAPRPQMRPESSSEPVSRPWERLSPRPTPLSKPEAELTLATKMALDRMSHANAVHSFVPKSTGAGARPATAYSISQAIINADADKIEPEGDIRAGKSDLPKTPPARVESAVTPPAAPPAAGTPNIKSQPLSFTAQPKKISFAPSAPAPNVVDLSKRTPIDLQHISSLSDLSKIEVDDIRAKGFNQGLDLIRGKIQEFSAVQKQPIREVAKMFYRSPVYNLYIAMGVAVMNDTSTDQKGAFDKVVKNYQAARKSYLSSEEFLALNRFKKDLET